LNEGTQHGRLVGRVVVGGGGGGVVFTSVARVALCL
jgi:hypothetical protein